jgi:hypothetical protein
MKQVKCDRCGSIKAGGLSFAEDIMLFVPSIGPFPWGNTTVDLCGHCMSALATLHESFLRRQDIDICVS